MLTLALLVILAQPPRDEAAPVPDPGWPANSARIFNYPGRVAWREERGRWTADFAGQPPANVLAEFAGLNALRRIVIHEPQPNRGWSFTAWQVDIWDWAPGQAINPVPFGETTVQLDVYGHVSPPPGVEVVDRRMHEHPAGNVIEGRLSDRDGKPLVGRISLQDVASCRTGPETVALVSSDAQGRWVLHHPTPSYYRLVAESEGFVPRLVGRITLDAGPQWKFFETTLARPVTVSGRVTDETGRLLEGARVNLTELRLSSGELYETPEVLSAEVDDSGRFSAQVPPGKATLWPYLSGWCRPGPGLTVTLPTADVALTMVRTAEVRITVQFPGPPAPRYRVSIAPEDKMVVGMHQQWVHLTRNPVRFTDVQPGRYIIRGFPESDETGEVPVSVTLESGKTSEVTLRAK